MAYGTSLGLSLPTLADTMTEMVTKTATALSSIQDTLAAKVTPAGLDINAEVDFRGNAATNVGALGLVGGNVPTAAGSIYYANGEFYGIDATGTIQITAAGNLNVAALGTIVGDYGGVNPARVTYVDSSAQYQFTEDSGQWADLVASDLYLTLNTGPQLRIGLHSTFAGGTLLFRSLPTTGKRLLCYDQSQTAIVAGDYDVAGTTFTGTHSFDKLRAATDILHGVFERPVSFAGSGSNITVEYNDVLPTAAPWTWNSHIIDWLRVGDVPSELRVRVNRPASSTVTISLCKFANNSQVATTINTDSVGPGSGIVDDTIAITPTTVATGERFFVRVSGTSASDQLQQVHLKWAH